MFILSKILLFLLNPLFWIFLLLLWSWLTRKATLKKRLRWIAIGSLFFFSNPFIINQLLKSYETPRVTLSAGASFRAGILLGGFIGFDENGQGFFNESSERMIQTLSLYKSGLIKKILISGGSGTLLRQKFREADFAKDQFIKMGVPPDDILIDRNSRNTYENAVYCKQIADSLQLTPPLLLITSAWHMPRAEACFKKAGLPVLPYSCDFKHSVTNDPEDFLIPSAGALGKWSILLKEWMGLLAYKITGKI